MKKVLKKALHYFDHYWHFLLAVFIISYSGFFLLKNQTIIYTEDFAGHFQKAKYLQYPSLVQGWDTTSWGGLSQDIYPSFYHLYLRTFIEFLPDTQAAKVSTFILIAALASSLWFLSKKLFSNRSKRQVLYAMFLLLISLSPSYYLGNIPGTLRVGGAPAILGLIFVIAFITTQIKPSSRSFLSSGLFFGLALLTHTLSASVIAIYIGVRVITSFVLKEKHLVKSTILSTLLGLVIGLPWIWVYLNPEFSSTRINMPGQQQISMIFILTISLLFLGRLRKKRHLIELVYLGLIMGILGSLPVGVTNWLMDLGISGLQLHRYLFIFLLLSPVAILSATQISRSTKRIVALFLIAIIPPSFIIANPAWANSRQIAFLSPTPPLQGRVIDAASLPKNYTIPNVLSSVLRQHTNLTYGTNLFLESAPLGVLFYTLTYGLNPNYYLLGFNYGIVRQAFDAPLESIKPQNQLDLLGVNYVAHTNIPPEASSSAIPIVNISPRARGPRHDKTTPSTIYLVPVSHRPLVETLSYLPPQSNVNFKDWWQNGSLENIYLHEPVTNFSTSDLDLNQPQTTNLIVSPQDISFSVTTQENKPAPIFIKFAYNKYWQATNEQGQALPIYWASPGYMLVLGTGNIFLNWQLPTILKFLNLLSWSLIIAITPTLIIKSRPLTNANY